MQQDGHGQNTAEGSTPVSQKVVPFLPKIRA
jgi:hypothetical protein